MFNKFVIYLNSDTIIKKTIKQAMYPKIWQLGLLVFNFAIKPFLQRNPLKEYIGIVQYSSSTK